MYKLIIAQPGTMHQIVSNDRGYLCSLLGNKTDEQKQDDADFILSAVNSYAALVEALENLEYLARKTGAFTKDAECLTAAREALRMAKV